MGSVLLNDAERTALITTARGLNQFELDALAFSALGLSIGEFGAMSDNMIVLASKFVSWITKRPDMRKVVDQIVSDYPNHTQIDILKALSARLSVAESIVPPQSFDAVLIDTAAVANRAPLRENLRLLATKAIIRPIVIVSGGQQSGRSHSWHLIRHVAKDFGIGVKRIDLEKWVTEQRTLDALYDDLLRALEIGTTVRPSSEGVTPETLGQRYANRIQENYDDGTAQPRWIVFDSTDRSMAQEIASFLRALCVLRLKAELLECTFFLLGDGTHLSFDEDANLIFKERLSRILPGEVTAAAQAINALGGKKMDDAALAAKVAAINAALAACADEECGKAVSDALNALRLAVEAP